MSQQTYTWHGPTQAITLHDATGAVVWEGNLSMGGAVDGPPPDHPIVVGWVAQRLLVVEPEAGETGQRRKRSQQEG